MLGATGMDHPGSNSGTGGPGAPGQQMNSTFAHHQMPQMNQLQPPVMNGVGGMQMAQVSSSSRYLFKKFLPTNGIVFFRF